MTGHLAPPHVIQFAINSGIPPELIAESAAWTAEHPEQLLELGFADYQAAQVPGVVFPYITLGGLQAVRYRPDHPRLDDRGKPVKYEQPAGSPLSLYAPPSVREVLDDPAMPLWVTEGEKKSLAAAGHGLACISLPGVWGWRGTGPKGGKTALPDWESIALNGREVLIAFDSDVSVKRGVQESLARFVPFLESRGAKVKVIYLPDGPDGAKVGLDDFLLDHSLAELEALATRDLVEPPVTDWQAALADKDAQEVIATQRERINQLSAQLDLAAEIARENAAALGLVRAVLGDPDKKMGSKAAFLSVWLEGHANPEREWDCQEQLAEKFGMTPETFRNHIRPFTTGEGPIIKIKGREWVADPRAPQGRRWNDRVRYDLRFTDDAKMLSAYLTVAKPEPKPAKPKESCLHLVTRTTQVERQLCTTCNEVISEHPIEPTARQTIFSCVGDHLETLPKDSSPAPCPVTMHTKKSRVGELVDAPAAIGDLMRRHQPRRCAKCSKPIAPDRPASDYCSSDCACAAPVGALA